MIQLSKKSMSKRMRKKNRNEHAPLQGARKLDTVYSLSGSKMINELVMLYISLISKKLRILKNSFKVL